jgi:hypothetical protein
MWPVNTLVLGVLVSLRNIRENGLGHWQQASNVAAVKELLRVRAGRPGGVTLWSYSGLLRAPETGDVISRVEGVEICRPIIQGTVALNASSVLQKLSVRGILENGDVFGTYMSRKAFVFLDKQTSMPLLAWRPKMRRGPPRVVSPCTVMDQIVTVVAKRDGRCLVHIQWPQRADMLSNDLEVTQESGDLRITSFIRPKQPRRTNTWISFAPFEQHKAGSQEYYAFRKQGLTNVGEYRRFGECPPWFSLGRGCSTELQLRKLKSLEHLDKSVLTHIKNECADFSSVPVSIEEFQELPDTTTAYQPWFKRLMRRRSPSLPAPNR